VSDDDSMTGRHARVDDWAPWAAGLMLAAPVLLAYYPPMTDLPFHEGSIGLLRHASDPSMVPPGLYVRNLGEPNQLFLLVGWLLSYGMSTRWAIKLVVAAAVCALPVAGARFARHVGASPLAALVVAPMALGWLFGWGLVANLVGLSALLATLPVLDRLAAEPTARRAAGALACTVLLYFAHMAMMFVSSGVALGLCLLQPWSWRKAGLRLSPFLAGIVITLAQTQWQKRFFTPSSFAIPRVWRPVTVKLGEIAWIVLPASDAPVRYAMMALCLLTLGFFFWLRARERRAASSPSATGVSGLARLRARALPYRWELVAAIGFAAFLAFPASLNGATLVYQRWFPPAFAILALVAAPRSLWTPAARTARIASFVLPVATLLVAAPSFADSSREYQSLDRLLARIEPGSAVAGVDLGPGDPSRTYSLAPAYARVLAERGGRLVYAFTDSPIAPMVIRRKYQWNEPLLRIGWDSWRFSPSHDFARFRYVVLRARDPMRMWMAGFALAEEAKLVDEDGDWALFESKSPVVPLTTPEVLPVAPVTDDLRQRMQKIKDALKDRPDVQAVEVPADRAPDPQAR
jgi:hypothetical protein